MRPACRIQPNLTRPRPRFGRDFLSFARMAMPFLSPIAGARARERGRAAPAARRRAARPEGVRRSSPTTPARSPATGRRAEIAWTYADSTAAPAPSPPRSAARRQPGDRAVLVFPPGLDFLAALLRLPVRRRAAGAGDLSEAASPLGAARRDRRRLHAEARADHGRHARDAAARRAVAGRARACRGSPSTSAPDAPTSSRSRAAATTPAFLQYTSGSTSQPRGVVVTHGNLLHNLELIRDGLRRRRPAASDASAAPTSAVFWLPAYHDMGLIGGILTPLYVGGTSYLMAPATFLQRPLAWLETHVAHRRTDQRRAELRLRAVHAKERRRRTCARSTSAAGGSRSAAPSRSTPATLAEFAEAFAPGRLPQRGVLPLLRPGRGDADGHRRRRARACRAWCTPTAPRLAAHELVDAGATPRRPAAGELRPAAGRSGSPDRRPARPRAAASAAGADRRNLDPRRSRSPPATGIIPRSCRRRSAAALADGRGPFLRTGDLGAFHDGELFVTGRLKDLIIIRGRNLYPQDVERTAQQAHEAVDAGAAFAVGEPGHEELVVVHQVGREHRRGDMAPVIRAIRAAIVEEHEVDPQAIVLLRPGDAAAHLQRQGAAQPLPRAVRRGRTRRAGALDAARRGAAAERRRRAPRRPARGRSSSITSPSYDADGARRGDPAWMLGWLAAKVEAASAGAAVARVDVRRAGHRLADGDRAERGIREGARPATAAGRRVELSDAGGAVAVPGREPARAWRTMGAAPTRNPIDSWFAAMDADAQRVTAAATRRAATKAARLDDHRRLPRQRD